MMIAITEKPREDPRTQANDRFLEMLPTIRRRAQFAFRSVPSEQREELVQESIANAYIAFVRLVDRGKANAAFATPLANYAIRHVLAARLAGSGLNSGDVLSRAARFGFGIVVESLDTFDDEQGAGACTGGRSPSRTGGNCGCTNRRGCLASYAVSKRPPDR